MLLKEHVTTKKQHRVKSEQLLSFYVKNLTSVLYLGLLCGHSSLEKIHNVFLQGWQLGIIGSTSLWLAVVFG